ncbi:hypothetical protein AMTRI_Chr08g164410 [Amborella trichopoda]
MDLFGRERIRKETGEAYIVVEGGEKENVMDLSFKLRRVNNNWTMLPNPRKRMYELMKETYESSSGEKPEGGTSSESSSYGKSWRSKFAPNVLLRLLPTNQSSR